MSDMCRFSEQTDDGVTDHGLAGPGLPTTPNISPVFKLKETSSKAIRVPFLVGISTLRFRTSKSG